MTTLRAATQQALEALEYHQEQTRPIWRTNQAIEALKAALAETVQEQKPYCFVYEYDSPFGLYRDVYPRPYNGCKPSRVVPVFTTPPQRRPLTDDEIEAATQDIGLTSPFARWRIARAIEAAHGIGSKT